MLENILSKIESKEDQMVDSLIDICRIPAFHPQSGGDGEAEKAKLLEELVKSLGLKYEMIKVPDDTVSAGYRPNIIVSAAEFDKNDRGRVWLVAHIDVVPPGELGDWKKPPFEPYKEGGKVYGRGVEDNGQAMISSLFALWALKEEGVSTNAAIALVADEETGSEKGIQPLIAKDIFKEDDVVVVSDWGTPEGDSIEIAEKSMLWCKLVTEGKQTHASTPNRGLNAFRAASHLLCRVDDALHSKFGNEDDLFDPPCSTFEPTKKEANVPNVNTVPGSDTFYFDCRILPDYDLDEVINVIKEQTAIIERERAVKVEVDFVMKDRSPQTSENSEVVQRVKRALSEINGIEARFSGIGGGTCAAFFRRKGLDAAVWQSCEGTAHQANESIRISHLVNDTKVFSHIFSN
jgi:succinyl-diaminopimelate desuccinylase